MRGSTHCVRLTCAPLLGCLLRINRRASLHIHTTRECQFLSHTSVINARAKPIMTFGAVLPHIWWAYTREINNNIWKQLCAQTIQRIAISEWVRDAMMDDGTTWGRRLHLNVYIVAETIVNQVIHIKKWMNV